MRTSLHSQRGNILNCKKLAMLPWLPVPRQRPQSADASPLARDLDRNQFDHMGPGNKAG